MVVYSVLLRSNSFAYQSPIQPRSPGFNIGNKDIFTRCRRSLLSDRILLLLELDVCRYSIVFVINIIIRIASSVDIRRDRGRLEGAGKIFCASLADSVCEEGRRGSKPQSANPAPKFQKVVNFDLISECPKFQYSI